jgi:hypothetical protein
MSNSYEVLTADNCCCASCRDLGFYNFAEYRSLVKDFAASKTATGEALFDKINEEDKACDREILEEELKNFIKDVEMS